MTSSTPIDICNAALNQLGAGVIQSFEEESNEAISCNLHYNRTRLGLLRDNPWTFALKRTSLAAVANPDLPPLAESRWKYVYELPSDVVRLQRVEADNDYRKEGQRILSKYNETIEILYVANIEDVKLFDPKFEEALVYKLASVIAYGIANDPQMKTQMFNLYLQTVDEARFCNAIEDIEEQIALEDQTFIDVRYGRNWW